MESTYITVKSTGTHEIIIQKSRFIAYVSRVETESEATGFIQSIKKKHWDATHNCSAYVVGENNGAQKANDDGEPSGTAGVPILEVIKKQCLRDVVIVVTRYFGGIKLGAGGLIRAYGSCASEGLRHVTIVERQLMQIVHVTVDYTLLGRMENELHQAGYQIGQTLFTENVTIEVLVAQTSTEQFLNWVTNLTNGKLATTLGDLTYSEREIE